MAKMMIVALMFLTIGSQLIPVVFAINIQNQSSTVVLRQPRKAVEDSIELSQFMSGNIFKRQRKSKCINLQNKPIHNIQYRECQLFTNDSRASYCLDEGRYTWFADENGKVFGHHEKCTNPKNYDGKYLYCYCVYIETIKSFSLRSQKSDADKNMVVTGVRFRLHNTIIHLEIKQSELLPTGHISDSASWKDLGDIVDKSNSSLKPEEWKDLKAGEDYMKMTYEQRTMNLDEIYVPDEYVVTGVRFALINSLGDNPGIKLQIRGTKFDSSSHKLTLHSHQWFDQDNNAGNDDAYKRSREEVLLDHCDAPSYATNNVEKDTNRFVKFRSTDVQKDLAEHVIPFLKKKSAETVENLPLRGIGLAYTGEDGFGGFITLKVFPYDTSRFDTPIVNPGEGSGTPVSDTSITKLGEGTSKPVPDILTTKPVEASSKTTSDTSTTKLHEDISEPVSDISTTKPVEASSKTTSDTSTTKPGKGFSISVFDISTRNTTRADPKFFKNFIMKLYLLAIVNILALFISLLI